MTPHRVLEWLRAMTPEQMFLAATLSALALFLALMLLLIAALIITEIDRD